MADVVVCLVVERLADLLVSEAKHLHGLSDEINEIRRELQRMQMFVEVAVKQLQDERDYRVRKWVLDTRKLAFRAEDVIETFVMEVEHGNKKSQLKKMLGRFTCMFWRATIQFQLALEIETIKSALINYRAEMATYGITNHLGGGTSNSQVNRKSSGYFLLVKLTTISLGGGRK